MAKKSLRVVAGVEADFPNQVVPAVPSVIGIDSVNGFAVVEEVHNASDDLRGILDSGWKG
ncbi:MULTISPECIES: hypothetical protein [Cyanophyceae]|uniref:hypothetical protein n=1 Tax=Cyanophyceae TaxID=3028117 RepID=UPI001689D496|nr:hypothetical protein [Phormidium sp. FACHB-592]